MLGKIKILYTTVLFRIKRCRWRFLPWKYQLEEIDEYGLLAPRFIRCIFRVYWSLTPLAAIFWGLEKLSDRYKHKRVLKWCFRDEKPSHKLVDVVVILALLFSIVIWVFLAMPLNIPIAVKWIIIILSVWRLIDIFAAWWWVHLMARSKTVKYAIGSRIADEREEPAPIRSIILVLINWVEIVFIFTNISSISMCVPAYDNLYYRLSIMVLDWGNGPPAPWLEALVFYLQIIFALLFILVIIQRAVSLIKK